MQLPDPIEDDPDQDLPEIQPIEQLEFFADIRPAFSYVNITGFGNIPAILQGSGEKVSLKRGDLVTVESQFLIYGAQSGNKGRKIKGVGRYIGTKKDEFVYLAQPVLAEIVAQHRPEEE